MYKCVCGFSHENLAVISNHKARCKAHKEYVERLLSLENIKPYLEQGWTVKEWYERFVDKELVSYVTCLNRIKQYIKDGLLKPVVKNAMQSERGKQSFQQSMLKKYSVSNPSQLEWVRRKQSEAHLRGWSFQIRSRIRLRSGTISSDIQNEVLVAVKENLNIHSVATNVKFHKQFEHDILLDSQLAIDVDGLYYHSTEYWKSVCTDYYNFREKLRCYRKRLETKFSLYQNLPYKVLTIDEWSWHHYKDFWLSKIAYELNLLRNKIDARKCEVREITAAEANDFHSKYNLHGRIAGATLHVGLFSGELLSVLSLVKSSSRQPVSHESGIHYEVARYTVKPWVVVRGGLSRLLSYASAKLNTQAFVSFVDARLSSKPPSYGRIVARPQLTYYVYDKRHDVLRHRLYMRKLVGGASEEAFIWSSPRYELYYTLGSWKLLLETRR